MAGGACFGRRFRTDVVLRVPPVRRAALRLVDARRVALRAVRRVFEAADLRALIDTPSRPTLKRFAL